MATLGPDQTKYLDMHTVVRYCIHVLSVELLYWPECPSHSQALDELRQLIGKLGIVDVEITLTKITTEEDATERAFIGSPTVRVNGNDVVAPPPAGPTALTCRVYRRRNGRPSPVPDQADIMEVLLKAASRPSDP
jgi:hypothetical protein